MQKKVQSSVTQKQSVARWSCYALCCENCYASCVCTNDVRASVPMCEYCDLLRYVYYSLHTVVILYWCITFSIGSDAGDNINKCVPFVAVFTCISGTDVL